VERAKIILVCLEGREVQQLARELRVPIPTAAKWRQRFSGGWEVYGISCGRANRPVRRGYYRHDTAFAIECWPCWSNRRHAAQERAGGVGETQLQRQRRLACPASRGNLTAKAAQFVGEYRLKSLLPGLSKGWGYTWTRR